LIEAKPINKSKNRDRDTLVALLYILLTSKILSTIFLKLKLYTDKIGIAKRGRSNRLLNHK
jgi:hypothetical protein